VLTHDLKVFNSSLTLDDEFGDQVEVGNVVTADQLSASNAKPPPLNSHSTSVELLPVHITESLPRCDRLERRRLQSRDKVLADGESRVACEADVAVTEGKLGEELDDVVSIFGVLGAEKLDVACRGIANQFVV
jgi:hypothetical protein